MVFIFGLPNLNRETQRHVVRSCNLIFALHGLVKYVNLFLPLKNKIKIHDTINILHPKFEKYTLRII